MPSGSGDYQDFLRFQAQAGQLIANLVNVPWTADITVTGIPVGQYQSIGATFINLLGSPADLLVTLTFSDDSAGLITTGQRTMRPGTGDRGIASIPVTGNFLSYTLNATTYVGRQSVSFLLYGYSWPIDANDMMTGDRSSTVIFGLVPAGGTVTSGIFQYSNTTATVGVITTAGPGSVELQQKKLRADSYSTRVAALAVAPNLAGSASGKMDVMITQLLARNTHTAAQNMIGSIVYGPL